MRRCAARLVSVWLFGLWLGGAAAHAEAWSLRGGEGLPGAPVSFDPERKTVFFRDPLTERGVVVPARELSLRSRQKLLFSPVFHERGGEGESLQSSARRRIAAQGAGVVALALGLGFWTMGWCCAGRWNPLLAGIGFAGTWILVGMLAVFYAFLKGRVEGGGGIVVVGAVATLAVTSLYVSAVYACRFWKGLLVLLGHLIVGGCFLAAAIAGAESVVGRERAEAWWNAEVFEPVGLIAPMEPEPRAGP